MFNDPSGEFIFTALAAWLGSKLLAAAVIGAGIGLISYTVGLAVTGNLHQWNIGGALKATFWGAVSGAVSFGLGELFQAAKVVKALGEAKFFVQAVAHGVSQGVLSVMQGGDFMSGAAGGFFGSLGSSAFGAIAGNFANSTVGTIAFGALSGGIGAELSGGNFWQGAVTGGIVAGLNHTLHRANTRQQIKNRLRDEFNGTGMNPDDKATFSDHESLTEKLPTLKNIKDKIQEKVKLSFQKDGISKISKGEARGANIHINTKLLSTKLDYAYTLGHEMIHVFDFVYNFRTMSSILGSDHTDARLYYSEQRAYQWELNYGNSNAIKGLIYLQKTANSQMVKYLNSRLQLLNTSMINP